MQRSRPPEAASRAALIVSTGRCGSSWLSSMLRLHPQVLSLSEFFSMHGGAHLFRLGTVSGRRLWEVMNTPRPELAAVVRSEQIPEILARLERPADGAPPTLPPPLMWITLPHLSDDPLSLLRALGEELEAAPSRPVNEHVQHLFGRLCRSFDRDVWAERSGASAEYADVLAREWPAARLVFLVREGPPCAMSMSRHPLFRMRVTALASARGGGGAANGAPALDRFGAYWSATMLKSWSAFASCRERALVILYDELVRDPAGQLERLAAFLELDPTRVDAWRSACASLPPREKVPVLDTWSRAELAALERSCRPGMRCLDRFRRNCA